MEKSDSVLKLCEKCNTMKNMHPSSDICKGCRCGYMILTPTPEHNGGMWCAEPKPCRLHGELPIVDWEMISRAIPPDEVERLHLKNHLKNKNMDIKTPKGWRKGQTIFNFLWWLKSDKGYHSEMNTEGRMADPFHIDDETLEKLFAEFLETH